MVGHDDELEDLEGVGGVRGSSRETELVAGGNADFVGLEAEYTINKDAELVRCLVDVNLRGAAEVSVRVRAVSKGKLVDIMLRAVILGTVVEESSNHASLATLAINHQRKTVELADCIDAARVDSLSSILRQPDIQVASSPLGASRSEIDIGDPMLS